MPKSATPLSPDPTQVVTIRQVAARCGISKTTAHAALRPGHPGVNKETAAHVRAVADEMGYDVADNDAARRMALRKLGKPVINYVIALFFPLDFTRANYHLRLFRGISEELSRQRFDLLVVNPDVTADLPRSIMRGDADGAMILTPLPESFLQLFNRLRGHRQFGARPVVALMLDMPESASVLIDDYSGAYAVAAHLLDLGHRRLLHFYVEQVPHDIKRLAGCRQACLDRGLAPEQCLTGINLHAGQSGDFIQHIRNTVQRALKDHPDITAIMTKNDFHAGIVGETLQKAGRRIPEDISLTGYDDTEALLDEQRENILTTVHLPLEELGRDAARHIVARVTGECPEDQHLVFPVSLVVRQSTAPPRRYQP